MKEVFIVMEDWYLDLETRGQSIIAVCANFEIANNIKAQSERKHKKELEDNPTSFIPDRTFRVNIHEVLD